MTKQRMLELVKEIAPGLPIRDEHLEMCEELGIDTFILDAQHHGGAERARKIIEEKLESYKEEEEI